MQTRKLGRSELEITTIGFGAWAIGGGDWDFGWGKQDDSDSVAAILRALELGINWIDTAAVYGLGHSEEVVARALAEYGSRDEVIVATKCGLRWGKSRKVRPALKAESVRQAADTSKAAPAASVGGTSSGPPAQGSPPRRKVQLAASVSRSTGRGLKTPR